MAVKSGPKKKVSLEINEFNLDGFKADNGFDNISKDKELEWIPFHEAYQNVLGLPGAAKGYVQLYRGFSNTGKSTAALEAMVACQKLGILPVYIDTENSFNWEHAKDIGVKYTEDVDEETGEIINHSGFFIYADNDSLLKKYGHFDYDEAKEKKEARTEACVEDVARFIDELLEKQSNGKLPYELCFIWDSIGTLDCFKSIKSKSKNNMWTAGAMSVAFKSILNYKIPASRKEGKDFTNTFIAVQKIWIDNMNGGGIKHSGGESVFYSARLIIHLGGQVAHGTSALKAISDGKTYNFGISTRIKCEKNHINGIELEGKIASTPHGYIDPDKIADYTKQKKKYLMDKLKSNTDDLDVLEELID